MKSLIITVCVCLVLLAIAFMSRLPQRVSAMQSEEAGHQLFVEGKNDQAISELRKAVRLDPSVAMYHNNLGWYLYKGGQSSEALPECQAAVRLDPSESESYDSEGAVLASLGRYQEAVGACQTAVQLRPSAVHKVTYGYALYKSGDHVAAHRQWGEAANMSDSEAAAQANAYLRQYP